MNTATPERIRSEGADVKVARPLRVLIPLIKESLDGAFNAGLEHYRAAGGMLVESKVQIRHGEWRQWLKMNFALSQESARIYMRLANSKCAWNFKTLTDFVRHDRDVRNPQAAQYEFATRPATNGARLRLKRHEREEEQELQRRLGLRLVAVGDKSLAAKLHPDVGGSTEEMVRLNQVCERLKRVAGNATL
jgi:hypothetical protein